MNTPWLSCFRPRPDATLRLLCLPYAGGGASVFRAWHEGLPPSVEVLAVQLPGRESRFREPPIRDLSELVPLLADALLPHRKAPFAIFGHSMGAAIALALCRELVRRRDALPRHLFVSGRRAPDRPARLPPTYHLPDRDFLEAMVQRYNAIPQAVLAEPELVALFLPMLKADAALIEARELPEAPPLDCPITAFGSPDDTIAPPDDIEAWRSQTRAAFDTQFFPGGHFFLNPPAGRTLLLQAISSRLGARV
jgi:medium-chain acyl-[acyl-carrier-protein] hydrolase